eukprot:TRINITY_DN59209_c0_g1_i1.p1 TRINITY_DN59209_c0_g1~~TRINITY_DN59209_c0_g1_i1.p1  ORF type:complete len:215 (+),score=36.92 TRINITY_DN59209_c0_g1_i1:40-684(+)
MFVSRAALVAARAPAEAAVKASNIDPERIARLRTFFARASVATRLMQSRLALPVAYPLNSAMMHEGAKAAPDRSAWKDEEIQKGLAHVTPIVVGMSKVASVLKAAQALSHYQGGHARNVAPDPAREEAEEIDYRLDFIRPQRLAGSGRGRGPGTWTTKTGKGLGWDDVSSGRTVDSPLNRFTVDPYEDTPELWTVQGKKFVPRTKWNKRKSGSQ